MRIPALKIITVLFLCGFVFVEAGHAYWIWTPETKKFTNPKYAVKDSPKEQFDWAMSFYDAKDFQRAASEFEKLAKQYEFSEYAAKSQYYVGLCYENMQKYYMAFENYQKAIDNFPHISNTDEILAREFAIGNIYLEKLNPKILGTDIMAPLDRAVEIFKKVVSNAPYGKHAEEAQFKLGVALKKSERFEEAVQAFHKLAEDYPKSSLTAKAMFEEADCAYRASLKPAYDASSTDSAIKTFEKFVDNNKDAELVKEADKTMRRLKDSVAEKSFKAAEFYESQGKKQAAIIYYQDVIDSYPESSFVNPAKARIGALKNAGEKKKEKPAKPVEEAPAVQTTQEEAVEIVKEAVELKPEPEAETAEAPKKSSWWTFNFNKEKKPEAAEAEAAEEEVIEKKPWKPFNFDTEKEVVAKKEPVKTPWKPLNFDAPKEKRPWKPFIFDSYEDSAARGDGTWKPWNLDRLKKSKPVAAQITKEE